MTCLLARLEIDKSGARREGAKGLGGRGGEGEGGGRAIRGEHRLADRNVVCGPPKIALLVVTHTNSYYYVVWI